MIAPRTPYRLPRRPNLLPTDNTGVAGGVDRGMPVNYQDEDWFQEQNRTNTGISGHGFPDGLDAGAFIARDPGTDQPDGAIVDTGPNTTNPGGPPGLETGGGLTPPPAAGGRRGWAGTGGTGLNLDMPGSRGGYGNLEGFNTTRAFAGGDENSVKDAFVRWVTGLGFDPARASKEEIENILRQNLDSAAEYGLNILDVDGENILIETAERGPEWVDVVRGAGAGPDDPDAAWQWGAAPEEGGGGGMMGGGGDMMGLPDLGGLPPELLEALGGDGDMLARIRAELDALVNGSPSPMGRDAMTQQLRAL